VQQDVLPLCRRIADDLADDAIADRAGEHWRSRQDRALSLDRQSLADSCLAALEMYAEAVSIAGQLFNDQQRSVVAQAVALARDILEARGRYEIGPVTEAT
jgi:hypothetical protein